MKCSNCGQEFEKPTFREVVYGFTTRFHRIYGFSYTSGWSDVISFLRGWVPACPFCRAEVRNYEP